MRINALNAAKLKTSENELEDQFTYLGSTVSNNRGTNKDIKCNTGKASAVLKTPRKMWPSTKMSNNTEIECLIPI